MFIPKCVKNSRLGGGGFQVFLPELTTTKSTLNVVIFKWWKFL